MTLLAMDHNVHNWQCLDLPQQLRIFQAKVQQVEVQLHQSVVHRHPVPVLRDSLPALLVGEVTVLTVDSEEVLDDFLGWSQSACNSYSINTGSRSNRHTENTVGILRRVVAEEPTREDVACIPRNRPSERPVVEVGVRRDGLLEADLGPLGHQVHAEGAVVAVLIGHLVPFDKLGQVETGVVARHVEIVPGVGRIGFDDVVGAVEASGHAYMQTVRSDSRLRKSLAGIPRRPNPLPRIFETAGEKPPMEKPGARERTSPTKTVPMTARMVLRSIPIP